MNQSGRPGREQAPSDDKSHINIAVGTFVCYFLCYFPGLIMNLYYLWQFRKEKQATGRTPEGQGILVGFLIGFGLVIPVVLVPCVGLMVANAAPSFKRGRAYSQVSSVERDLKVIATAIESYRADNNQFPAFTTRPEMTHDFDLLDADMRRKEQIPTFARTNWQGSEDPGAGSLTTPLAYILRRPGDPFASPRGASYRYWHDVGGFIIWSAGPDGEYAITDPGEVYSSGEVQPSEALLLRTYDPTNGIFSPGDIWRARQR